MSKTIPTVPGIYVDRFGDPWKLAHNGYWYDKGYVNGMSNRDQEHLLHRAPFTLLASAEALDTLHESKNKDTNVSSPVPVVSDTRTAEEEPDEQLSLEGLRAFVQYQEKQVEYHQNLHRKAVKLLSKALGYSRSQ